MSCVQEALWNIHAVLISTHKLGSGRSYAVLTQLRFDFDSTGVRLLITVTRH